MPSGLSGKALAVLAFAAYHQWASGQAVRSVVQQDGAAHKASDKAVAEFLERGLIETGGRGNPLYNPGTGDPAVHPDRHFRDAGGT